MTEEAKLFPRAVVREVFLELAGRLDPAPALGRPHALCERFCAVGGFRRCKLEMKDLEILVIPRIKTAADPSDLFGGERALDLTEALWEELLGTHVLEKRLSKTGQTTWGPKNKHAVHVATGLPLDIFMVEKTGEAWFNRLVVTTGPAEQNIEIASAARKKGWEWEVYDAGFVPLGMTWETATKTRRTMRSEADVFAFVGLDMPELPGRQRGAMEGSKTP